MTKRWFSYPTTTNQHDPHFKLLEWHRTSLAPTLNAEDVAGLKHIEVFRFGNWHCPPEQVHVLLRLVAGTLQELEMVDITGLRGDASDNSNLIPADLAALSPLLLNEDEQCDNSNNNHNLVMTRLKTLAWDYTSTSDRFITQLVKYCPRLKTLDLY